MSDSRESSLPAVRRRYLVLWNRQAPYALAALNALAREAHVEAYFFGDRDEEGTDGVATWSSMSGLNWWRHPKEIGWKVVGREFDVVLVSGWTHVRYLLIAALFSGRAKRVLLLDTQWNGSHKQRLASILAPIIRKKFFDFAFVPGRRQADFAMRLGFADQEIRTGLYTCDSQVFQPSWSGSKSRDLLFVGRLVPQKGIREFRDAYLRYRLTSSSPMGLTVIGSGNKRCELEGVDGVRLLGDASPEDIARHMASHRCFVLPSIYEPWGVVLHEAATVGMPIIASQACGASDDFVSETNGWLVEPGSIEGITNALLQLETESEEDLRKKSSISGIKARGNDLEMWVKTVKSFAD